MKQINQSKKLQLRVANLAVFKPDLQMVAFLTWLTFFQLKGLFPDKGL